MIIKNIFSFPFAAVLHTWVELVVDNLSILLRDAGTGGLWPMKLVNNQLINCHRPHHFIFHPQFTHQPRSQVLSSSRALSLQETGRSEILRTRLFTFMSISYIQSQKGLCWR